MKNIVGVRFKKPGKIYFFNPNGLEITKDSFVIVDTASGEEYGEVIIANRQIPEEKVVKPLKDVIRIATQEDQAHHEKNKKHEKEAFSVCLELIKKHKLEMNLIDVEYKFDNTKLLFYFTADGRIDFRELVKDLAAKYRTRIELRQIGVRDEVKRIGGNGVCGRELCCCSFLTNFETVSIKMAKEQNISLNPSKISGNCGRLMCCLKYEQNVYEEKLEKLPKIGAIVKTEDGEGTVEGIETLKERLKVRIKIGEDFAYKYYNATDVQLIKDAKIIRTDDIGDEIQDKEQLKELKELEKLEKAEAEKYEDEV